MNCFDLNSLRDRVRHTHRHEGGAMLVLGLASILIIIMVSMTLFDAAELGSEKSHIQTATDTSAFSQATVEARGMNMMAFSNAGKRMTVGKVNTYLSMNQWLLWLSHLATLTEILGWIGQFVPGLQAIAQQVQQASRAIRDMQRAEEPVRDTVATKRAKRFFRYWSTCSCGWGCSYPCVKTMRYDEAWGGASAFWEWWAPDGPSIPLAPPDVRRCGSTPGSRASGAISTRNPLSCANGDIMNWSSASLIDNYFGRDLQAYDNYQRYMEAIVPYWAWTEGVTRGIANAAPITVSYPPPNFEQTTNHTKALPIERGRFRDTCDYVYNNDRGWTSPMGIDYILKNIISFAGGGSSSSNVDSAGDTLSDNGLSMNNPVDTSVGGNSVGARVGEIIALVLVGQATLSSNPLANTWLTPRSWDRFCRDVTSDLFRNASRNYRTHGQPYLVREYDGDRSQWLMDTSNLMFGFRPNSSRFGQGREKFLVPGEYNYLGPDAGGTWALSRAEIAFQGGSPNAWSPEWTARMRPVALPGEWEDLNGFALADAFTEISDTLAFTTAFTGQASPSMGQEIMAITAAVEGLDNARIEGVAR